MELDLDVTTVPCAWHHVRAPGITLIRVYVQWSVWLLASSVVRDLQQYISRVCYSIWCHGDPPFSVTKYYLQRLEMMGINFRPSPTHSTVKLSQKSFHWLANQVSEFSTTENADLVPTCMPPVSHALLTHAYTHVLVIFSGQVVVVVVLIFLTFCVRYFFVTSSPKMQGESMMPIGVISTRGSSLMLWDPEEEVFWDLFWQMVAWKNSETSLCVCRQMCTTLRGHVLSLSGMQ